MPFIIPPTTNVYISTSAQLQVPNEEKRKMSKSTKRPKGKIWNKNVDRKLCIYEDSTGTCFTCSEWQSASSHSQCDSVFFGYLIKAVANVVGKMKLIGSWHWVLSMHFRICRCSWRFLHFKLYWVFLQLLYCTSSCHFIRRKMKKIAKTVWITKQKAIHCCGITKRWVQNGKYSLN